MNERFKQVAERGLLAAAVAYAGSPLSVEASSNISFGRGEEKPVTEKCVISGDLVVDGVPTHDNDAASADIVEIRRPATVRAPWGASGICGTDEEIAAWANKTEADKLASGKFGRVNRIVIASSVVETPEYTGTCTSDAHMANGEKRVFPAGTLVKGDIKFNGVELYDDKPETGLITELAVEGEVEAPWGANVQVVKNCMTNASEIRENIKNRFDEQMHESGCGSKCEHVDRITVPGQTQKQSMTIILPASVAANLRSYRG